MKRNVRLNKKEISFIKNIILKAALMACAAAVCCSCGPSFKSMKDTENFLIQKRAQYLKKGHQDISYTRARPDVQNSYGHNLLLAIPGGISGVTMAMTRSPFEFMKGGKYAYSALAGLSEEQKNEKIKNEIVTLRTFIGASGYFTIYRNEPGRPEWDIGREMLKRAGEPPIREGCTVVRFNPRNAYISKKYEGENDRLEIGSLMAIMLAFEDKKDEGTSCTVRDLIAYHEYMDSLAEAAKSIIKEELDQYDAIIKKDQI